MAEESSLVNKYLPEWKLLSQFNSNQSEAMVKSQHNIVSEILSQGFNEISGTYSVSSSTCATPEKFHSDHDYDRRLKTWMEMVEEQKSITQRIQQRTGKATHDVLIYRSTADNQEKNMVKRVLEFSHRLDPSRLAARRLLRMPEYYNPKTCLKVHEICETLPRSEREQKANIEIVGMPNVTKKEQFGCTSSPRRKSDWMCSKVLEENVEKKCSDIVRVLEFYPDVEHLQVVGRGLLKETNNDIKSDSVIKLVKENIEKTVSKSAIVHCSECKCKFNFAAENKKPPIIYGIKINEHTFIMGMPGDAPCIDIKMNFECYPFEIIKKCVLHLENIGQKILDISLVEKNYFPDIEQTLKRSSEELIIDSRPFRLLPGEEHDIFVLYQPHMVGIVKKEWILNVDPKFFIHTSGGIVLKLCGQCRPPEEYLKKINDTIHDVRRTIMENIK